MNRQFAYARFAGHKRGAMSQSPILERPKRASRANPGRIRRRLVDVALRDEDRLPKRTRPRHEKMRLSLRLQAIEEFERATGTSVVDPIVRKIALKPEIELIAQIDGRARQMRWSYADGTLVRMT
jgi:hypothetical protein